MPRETCSHRPCNAGHGLRLAQRGRDCGEDQRAGKGERRRVAGADADQAEDGRARFGNVGERAIESAIAAVADLLS